VSEELDLTGESEEQPAKEKEPKKPTRKRERGDATPRTGTSETDLRRRIEDGIGEIVEFIERRLGDAELAAIIREDAPKMAEILARRAMRHQRLARVLTRLFGKDSLLAIVRAFGPTLRALLDRLPRPRLRREEEEEEGARVEYGTP
jgi:hypothetical protein